MSTREGFDSLSFGSVSTICGWGIQLAASPSPTQISEPFAFKRLNPHSEHGKLKELRETAFLSLITAIQMVSAFICIWRKNSKNCVGMRKSLEVPNILTLQKGKSGDSKLRNKAKLNMKKQIQTNQFALAFLPCLFFWIFPLCTKGFRDQHLSLHPVSTSQALISPARTTTLV